MKKTLLFLLTFTFLSSLTAIACDQVFDGGMLRYNYSYVFSDTWHNGDNRPVYLNNYNISFVNPSFLDKGGNFAWTQQLRDSAFTVSPKSSMKVLETSTPKRKIANKPNTRTNGTRNSYDFGIEYTITYDFSNNYPNTSDDRNHKECVYYSVTWCGDGILDTPYEQCDPNDSTRTGWGPGGCSNTCTPLNPPVVTQPTCTSLTYDRNNNNYNFLCRASSTPTGYNLYDGSGNLIQRNTTGRFSNINLNNISGVNCRLDNEISNNQPIPTACNIPGISTRLSCDSLTATPPTGAGIKTFTSRASSTLGSVRHELSRGAQVVGNSGVTGLVYNFQNISTEVNNSFRSTVYDSLGNSATSDACVFTVRDTITPPPACGTAARTFAFTETSWGAFTFCANGTPSPVNPVFPAPMANTTWTCNGTTGTPVTCRANRLGDTPPPPPPPGGSSCVSLTANPSSSTSGNLNTLLTCNASGTSLYNIELRNSGGTLIGSSTTSTLTANNLGVGTYNATCRVAGELTAIPVCTTTLSVTSTTGGGGGCRDGGVRGIQTSPISQSTPGLCELGRTVASFTSTVSGNTINYSWQCSGQSGASCTASYNSGGGGTPPPGGGGGNYCGDGTLQRPNTDGMMEQCDFGGSAPWTHWPEWCGRPNGPNACQIIESTRPSGNTFWPENTIPGGGDILLQPTGSILLGDGMSIFGNLSSSSAMIRNNSISDIFIDKPLCIEKVDSYGVIEGSNICSSQIIGRLNANTSRQISVQDRFITSTQGLGSLNYADARLITKVQGVPDTSFLNAVLNIRVAKSSINTGGGGAGLLKNSSGISDVQTLSTNFGPLRADLNKNLILSSLGITPLSSNVNIKVTDSQILQLSSSQGNKDISGLDQVQTNISSSTLTTLPTTQFQGMNNVFIHKGNVSLGTVVMPMSRTYIIEGDLTLTQNIISPHSVLFVVKNGNITIGENVTKIDAILISMDGKIQSDGKYTNNVLNVQGALYGNISDLIEKRIYMKSRESYVDVGTNIQFSSRTFISPPPLLSRFLGEFIQGDRIAK